MPYIDFDESCESDINQVDWIRQFNERVAKACYGEPIRSEDNAERRKGKSKKRSGKTTKSSSRKKR